MTDPASRNINPKWKQQTKDVLGNLTTVVEPNPAGSPSIVVTSHTYNPLNQLTCVDMDPTGSLSTYSSYTDSNQITWYVITPITYTVNNVTCNTAYTAGTGTRQTRTFVYDGAGRLTSATNPENGTVTYTYNTTNTLATKTDAKNQQTVYTYDSNNRVTEVQRFVPQYGYQVEDVCQRVTYTYDTNPVNANFSQYSTGRLTTVTVLRAEWER